MGLGKVGGQGGIVGVRVAGVGIRFSCDFGQRVPVSRGKLDHRGLFARRDGRDLRFG